ncbi:hypothetical protein GCM10010099_22550 [Streptomyces cinereus]|nr:hypothetical protein GCM10010099_22550 [Streptomyces cinereus]
MSTTIDPEAFAEALAEVIGIRTKQPTGEAPNPRRRTVACCSGTRTAYQRHVKRGEEPCVASKRANTEYVQARRGRRGASRKEPQGCPSYSGYQTHMQRGEEPCDGCKEARREYDREQYAKKPDGRRRQRAYAARQRAARAA